VTLLLNERRAALDSLAGALLERETLDEDAAYAAAGIPRHATPDHEGPPLEVGAGDTAPADAEPRS